MTSAKILVVEDESIVARDIADTLKKLGYDVPAIALSAEQAIQKTEQIKPDLVLMDIVLKGDVDGIEAAEQIRRRFDIPVLYLTAYTDEQTVKRAKVTEPFGYITKPFDKRQLYISIEMALYKHKMERLLQKERDKAQKYLDVAGVMLVAIDSEQRVGLINKKGCEILGYKEEEILAKKWFGNFLPERIRKEVRAVFEKVIQSEADAPEYYENHVLTKNGDERLIAWRNTFLRDEKGNVIATLSSGEDITERKKAEEALQASEEKYRDLFENAGEGIITLDLDGRITEANRLVEEYGFNGAELLGRRLVDFVPEYDKARSVSDFQALVAGSRLRGQMDVITPKGIRTVEYRDTPIVRAGEVIGVQAILTDITERKRAEEALRGSEEKFKGIFEHANDGVIYLDSSGNILDINEKAARMFGGPKQHVLNKHFTEVGVFTADEMPTLMSNFEKIFAGEEVVLTVPIKNKKGREIILECSASVAKTDDGAGRIMVIARDITERKKAEEQITKLAKFPAEDPYPVLRISGYGTVIYGNKAGSPLLKFWGCRVGESLPDHWQGLVLDALSSGQSQHTETQCDGRIFSLTFAPVVDANYVNIYGHDITERKKAEKELIENQAKLKAMASKILMTQERERQHLAVGLHDEVCQKLVLTKLALESSMNLVSDSKVLASLKIACAGIGETIEKADSLTFELSNPVLRELGFVAALERYLDEEIRQKHGIVYELRSDEHLSKLTEEIKNCLYRVTRELLTNVVKHAHAHKIKVSAQKSQSQICVVIQDDGVGFKYSEVGAEISQTARFGLFSVREQLEYLGGNLEIESEPGQGTTAKVVVPLTKKAIV
jgi:PAS domain S-box-containing protein